MGSLTVASFTFIVLVATLLVLLRRQFHQLRVTHRQRLLASLKLDSQTEDGTEVMIAGFMHPYCNAGGGGERVLWAAIAYLQRTQPEVLSVVYTGDVDPKTSNPITKDEIILRCRERFGIHLDPKTLHFVHLEKRWLIADGTWKRFTLLGQGIGAAVLAYEAMSKLVPDIYFDTLGLAFTYPVVRLLSSGDPSGRVPIVTYTHYPTISASMLKRVSNRETTYANDASVTGSGLRSTLKLIYYRLFSYLYTSCLLTSPPTLISVNSSWTNTHIQALLSTKQNRLSPLLGSILEPFTLLQTLIGFNAPTPVGINQPPQSQVQIKDTHQVRTIFPPCDVESLKGFDLERRHRIIFSCAQFRPEKDHALQIKALARLLEEHPELSGKPQESDPEADSQAEADQDDDGVRLVLLGSARHADDLKRVQTLRDLTKELGVEGAGLIPVVHASGGPVMDIVVPFEGEPTGFHAVTVDEFATQLHKALTLPPEEALAMRERARRSSERFSTTAFERGFGALWEDVRELL
ncbi:GDP-Man:Man(3)GlcNAc(2)-PP-Dol alpha-1,2-mannosyltransferase; AltName: Full=Asparagine-linked glycosylation protein 11 homolog; AltName: Full=Glycolipid 2-alpha-mannosyltransferase [Serendipita indica DSM 11827]|nr:GDP-Man:Man(3)GlcNAc(2)-PP-Dol alpha-1,2-mannosyltransferase; AltName: Full=Asparagine-linked glycosylation protein 11 homolog; AltName: Full=Glycolipid 2-alpha-mannosyltransferase [Serendipita indica DSM 11827]